MDERWIRAAYLLGDEPIEKLKNKRVAVFGIGGVGSFCAEALVRLGIAHLTFVDPDTVSISNRNRQLIALESTVGEKKVEVMRRRALDINPDADIRTLDLFYLPENADSFDVSEYDCIVDAVDTVSAKIELIGRAVDSGVPIVSCMGTGNKLHPELLEITDISKTSGCPLARVMRRELRQRGIEHLTVVYSREQPIGRSAEYREAEKSGRTVPGSISFVPATAGMLLASAVFQELTK